MTAARVPSVDEMTEVRNALLGLLQRASYSCSDVLDQERDYLPPYCRLADALRPIRPLVDQMEGWPDRLRRALRVLIEWFDEITREWGWERLSEPEPLRSAYIAERHAWFEQEYERPIQEIALSWQAGAVALDDCPPFIDALAERGRQQGYRPTMSLSEAQSRLRDAQIRRDRTPRLGRTYPVLHAVKLWDGSLTPEFEDRVNPAYHAIFDALRSVEGDQNQALRSMIDPEVNDSADSPTSNRPEVADATGTHSSAQDGDKLSERMRRAFPRAKLQAALVAFMADRDSAPYVDIAQHVHGDVVTEGSAIKQLVRRTNDALLELDSPMRFRCGGEYVFKDVSPS